MSKAMKELNELEFLKRLNLIDLGRNLVEKGYENGLLDSDIFTIASLVELWYNKEITERERLLSTLKLHSKDLTNATMSDNIDLFIKEISKVYFTNKVMIANVIPGTGKIKIENRIFKYCTNRISELNDEDDLNMFINNVKANNYRLTAFQYLSFLCTGRISLISTVTNYMKENNTIKNFMYQFNREIITITSLLLEYGKGVSDLKVSDELLTLSDEAVHEMHNKMNDEVQSLYNQIHEMEMTIKRLEIEKDILESTINETTNTKYSKLNGLKVLIIGDEGRKVHYTEILKQYGADEVNIISGVDHKGSFVKDRAEAHDLIFFFTDYMKHRSYEPIKHMSNLVKLTSGLSSLENKINEIDLNKIL